MSRQLDDSKRDELYAEYCRVQSMAHVARVCGVHENTVRKYRITDGWDQRIAKVQRKAMQKADETAAQIRARWQTMGKALIKSGAEFLFNKDGTLKKDVIAKLKPKEAMLAIKLGIEIEQMALGDTMIVSEEPLALRLVDKDGNYHTLPPPPKVVEAEFEAGDAPDGDDDPPESQFADV